MGSDRPGGGGAAPPAARQERFDWESFIGVKMFSWAAGVLLAVSAVFFLAYSIDHGFLTRPVQLGLGLAVGLGLLVACELKTARRYAVTANALAAAGIVILFSTLYAAYALWHLLGAPAAFALMVLVTAVAVALSLYHDSLFIALLGLIGGFATPALLAGGQDRPISLFGYLLLLNAGLAWVGVRRSWPWLSVLALTFTTVYQWAWVVRFLAADRLPLAIAIFLIFPAVSIAAAAQSRRGRPAAGDGIVERTAQLAASLPLVFALYAMSVRAYGTHFALLFGFLLLVDAGLAVVAAWRGPQALHLLGAGTSLLALVVWLGSSYQAAAWPAVLGFVALLVLFYLGAPAAARRLGRPLGEAGRRGALAASCFLLALPVLLVLEPATAAPGLPFGVLFALLAAVAAYALAERHGTPHYVAAFFALAAEAVWAGRYLTPERLLAGVAVFAAFGLLYLAVPVAGRRLGRPPAPREGGAIVLLASLLLLLFLTAGGVAQQAVWGMSLLLAILQVGLTVEAAQVRRPDLALAGTVLSWILIGLWWSAVPLADNLVPALLLVSGFTVLGLVGSLWPAWRAGESDDAAAAGEIGNGAYLALTGHIFLLFVATQDHLALPPWPLFGALALLDLAAGIAALWTRRAALWVAALLASDLMVLLWLPHARGAPWPTVGLFAAAAVSALAVAWPALARRLEAPRATGAGEAGGAADSASAALSAAAEIRPKAEGLGTGETTHVAGTASVGERSDTSDKTGAAAARGASAGAPVAGWDRTLAGNLSRGAAAVLLFGQVAAAAATLFAAAPSLGAALAVQLASLAAILALAGPAGWPPLALWSVATAAIAAGAWQGGGPPGSGRPWWSELVFATALYVPYLVFPLALGARARRLRAPFLAAIVASAPYLLFARVALVEGGWRPWIGALPLAQALGLAGLLAVVRRLDAGLPQAERDQGRLATVAGAVLAMVTVAVPLQLHREWTTVGWALLAAALAWLYGRIPHRGLLWWTAGLLAAVFLRLAVNPAVLAYHPRSGTPIWNWYLYTYLIPAAAALAAARLLARAGNPRLAAGWRLSAAAAAEGVLLLFLALNIEIADFYSTGTNLTFGFLGGTVGLAEDLTYTLGWGLFAISLLIAGIALRSRPSRIAAILLLSVAALKGFLLDMAHLGGLYRVGSFAGLAICLALVAVLLQKFVLTRPKPEAP